MSNNVNIFRLSFLAIFASVLVATVFVGSVAAASTPSTPTASNTILDVGQSTFISSRLPTSSSAVTYNWLVQTPGSSSFTEAASSICSTPSGTGVSNQIETCAFATNSLTQTGNYLFEIQSNSTGNIATSQSSKVTVNTDPSFFIWETKKGINQNQSLVLYGNVMDGTGSLYSVWFTFVGGQGQSNTLLMNDNTMVMDGNYVAGFLVNGKGFYPKAYTIEAYVIDYGSTTPYQTPFDNSSQWISFTVYPGNTAVPASTSTSTTTTTVTSTSTTTIPGTFINAISGILSNKSPLDIAQILNISAPKVNGSGPFTYNFIVSNAISHVVDQASGNTTTNFTFYGIHLTGLFDANVLISNDSHQATVSLANPSSFTVNPTLQILQTPVLNITTVPLNGNIKISTLAINGTTPYTFNFIISDNATNVIVASSGPQNANTFVYSGATSGYYQANVIVEDSAGIPETANSLYSAVFTIGTPSTTTTSTATSTSTSTSTTTVPANTLKATSSVAGKAPYFDVGQIVDVIAPEIINATKYDFFIGNASTLETSGNILSNSTIYITYATGFVSANILITNNTNTTRYNAIPANFTVNPSLGVLENPIINETNVPINTSVLITTYAVNGTAPYTYNFIVSNSTSNNIKLVSGPLSSNTFKYYANTLGAFQANVIITDSAGVPESINSLYSVSFTVNNSTVNTTTTTTTVPQNNGGGGGGSVGGGGGGAGTPHPVEKLEANSCYVISNFATPAYFNNVTINGTTPTVTENYITPTFAGISINGAPYQINPNTTPTVVNGGTDHEYTIALLNITILPLQNTITIELCPTGKVTPLTYNVSSSAVQPTWIEIFANKVSVANVSITNYSTPAIPNLPKLPANMTVLSVFNITAKGIVANSTVNVTAHYPCTVSAPSVSVYLLSNTTNSTWSKVASASNASSCTTIFTIPSDPIVALMQGIAPTSPQVPVANATTTVPTTTIPSGGSGTGGSANSTATSTPKSNMKDVEIWIGAGVIILAIIAGIVYQAYQSKKVHKVTSRRRR